MGDEWCLCLMAWVKQEVLFRFFLKLLFQWLHHCPTRSDGRSTFAMSDVRWFGNHRSLWSKLARKNQRMKRPWRTGIKKLVSKSVFWSCTFSYSFEKATFFATTKLWQIFAGFAWDTDSSCWQLPDKATSWHRHKGHRWQLDHSHLLISFLVTLWISKSAATARSIHQKRASRFGDSKQQDEGSSGWACFCIEICGSTRDVESPCSFKSLFAFVEHSDSRKPRPKACGLPLALQRKLMG